MHIQAVESNPLLPSQCRVDGLAAQRCPIVFPFNRNSDGAGHTEGLPVFLLGYHTWRETERDEMMEGMRTGWGVRGGKKQQTTANIPAHPFIFHAETLASTILWWKREGDEEGRGTDKERRL